MRRLLALLFLLTSLSWGSVSSYVGSFAFPTTGNTGNHAITAPGFQPIAVIFFISASQTADGSSANAVSGIGLATDSTHRGFWWGASLNGSVSNNTGVAINTTKCLSWFTVSSTPTVVADADFVSMDATGFTYNATTVDGTARIVNYIALGGSSITNAFVGGYDTGTTTATKAYTGVGFQPDALMLIETAATAVGAGIGNNMGLGFATSTSSRATFVQGDRNGQNPTQAYNYQRTAKAIAHLGNTGALQAEADFTSFDADGFTLNWTTSNATARKGIYLALKGASVAIGSFNQPTSTTTSVVSGLGFQPAGVILASFNKVAATTASQPIEMSLGIASDSTHRAAISWGSTGAVSSSVTSSNLDRANVLKMITENGASPTFPAVADFTSMDSGGFTINWTTADATARQVIYVAIGPGAPAGGSTKTVHKVTQGGF